jgi:hypothetical protein
MSLLGIMLVRRVKRSGKVGVYLSQDAGAWCTDATRQGAVSKYYRDFHSVRQCVVLASHDIIAYIQHDARSWKVLALQWYSGFTLRHTWVRDNWTLTLLSSTLYFNLMSKAEKKSGRSSKYMTPFAVTLNDGSTAGLVERSKARWR